MPTKPEKIYTINGRSFTVTEVCEEYRRLHGKEIRKTTIHNRLRRGYDFDELVQESKQQHNTQSDEAIIRANSRYKDMLKREKDERLNFFKLLNKALNV